MGLNGTQGGCPEKEDLKGQSPPTLVPGRGRGPELHGARGGGSSRRGMPALGPLSPAAALSPDTCTLEAFVALESARVVV